LALGGAALFALAAWLPWITVTASPARFDASSTPQISTSVRLLVTPGSVGAPPLTAALGAQGALFIWSALTVLGIPLAALAWMRVSRPLAWLTASGYGLWLVVTVIFSITSAQYLLQSSRVSIQEPGNESLTSFISAASGRDVDVGLWLSGLALLVCLVGLWALIAAVRGAAPSTESSTRQPRPAAQTPGAGALTFGLVLWAVGFLWLAWASLNCPSFVLVYATCKGLASEGAMSYAISRANVLELDPRMGEYAISILLALGALFIGVGVWRRGVTSALCGWATVWLVAAAAFAALAWYGVNLVVNDPTQGTWRGESGILFTAAALLVCLAGVGLLWFALLFHRTQSSAA
jgi:hypothetical protein